MPERQYTITYTIDDAGFQAARARIEAGLRAMDAQAEALKGKIGGLFTGTSRSMTTFERHLADEIRLLGMLKTNLDSAAAGATGMGTAVQGVNTHLPRMGTGATTAAAGLGRLVSIGSALMVLRQVIEAATEGLAKAAEYAERAAAANAKIREGLREVAAMQGGGGTKAGEDAAVRGVVQRALATHASLEEQKDFDFMFANMLPNVKKTGNWQLDDEQTEEFKKQAEVMAIRLGIKPGDMGRFAPALGLSGPVTSVEGAMGQLSTITNMEMTGVGHMDELLAKSGELRGQVDAHGAAKTEADMAAILATATLDTGSVAKAGTSITQMRRAQTQMIAKHPKIAQQLGVTAADDIPTFLEKLAPGMAEADRPGGEGSDIWLMKQGVNLQQSRMAIEKMTKRLPILRKSLEEVRNPHAAGAAAMEANRAFGATGAAQGRDAATTAASADIIRGESSREALAYLGAVESEMKVNKEIDTGETSMTDSIWGIVPFAGGAEKVRQRRIINKAAGRLIGEANRVGAPLPEELKGARADDTSVMGQESYTELYNKLMPAIRARGGKDLQAESIGTVGKAAGTIGAPQVVPVPRPPQSTPPAPAGFKSGEGITSTRVDASHLDAASDKLASVADALAAALRERGGGRSGGASGGLPGLGGPTDPYRA